MYTRAPRLWVEGGGRGISIIQQKMLTTTVLTPWVSVVGGHLTGGGGVNDVLTLGAMDTQGTNSRTSTVTQGPKALKIEGPHKNCACGAGSRVRLHQANARKQLGLLS